MERTPSAWMRILLTLVLFLGFSSASIAQLQQALLNAVRHPKFVNPLPNPLDPAFVYQSVPAPPGTPLDCVDYFEVGMVQTSQSLGLVNSWGTPLLTKVWAYAGAAQAPGLPPATYPGRTFVVQGDANGIYNRKACVQWTNDLFDNSVDPPQPLLHFLPLDPTVHWAFALPGYTWEDYLQYGVPVVPHVHGGHTESDSDGLPEYWWTPGEGLAGPRFVKSLYEYDNDQEAGTLWYHDHGLGITRLNVYAGLAGFYIVRDEVDTGLPNNPLGLPTYPYEVPLVIQDRLFTADGQLHFPASLPSPQDPGPPNPTVLPEFFGDFIMVNGQAWPVQNVEPRKYRYRILNGSDSRFYNIWIGSELSYQYPPAPDLSGPAMYVIGTDTGLLERPVKLRQLTIGPGERYDIIVDFAGYEGRSLLIRNNAAAPFPDGDPVDPRTNGLVMAFHVGTVVTVPDNPLPEVLRPPINPKGPAVRTRKLILFEGEDAFGRLQPMLGVAEPTVDVQGNLVDGTLLWDAMHYPITENPMVDDVEIWEVYNTTVDAHPIHLHLVSFLLQNRQKIDFATLPKTMVAHDGSISIGGTLARVSLVGGEIKPLPQEQGYKDTALMYPGQVTRVIARFDRPGRYVWHCHILSHEDHEMMRPYCVGVWGIDCFDPPTP